MPAKQKPAKKSASKHEAGKARHDVAVVVESLHRLATKHTLEGMARYAIPSEKAFGVSMADMKVLAKRLGRDHELAADLWKTGGYEARMLATLVDEPAMVTPAQMDRWCKDFDSWAICDTACFWLFDRTPHAWGRIGAWCGRRKEFEKRAAFALVASVALHNKQEEDARFVHALTLAEEGASDGRNFVKKGVSWALRGIGGRNPGLRAAALEVAERLAESSEAAPRWVGRDVIRGLAKRR